MSAAFRNAPRPDVCELDGSVLGRPRPGRRELGVQDLGPSGADRRVSAVVDVRTLQSLRIVLPPPVDGGDPTLGHPGQAVPGPRRARRAAPADAGHSLAGELREPAFDELVRGPGPQPAGSVAPAHLTLLARVALRARLASPRRAASFPAGRR